MGYANACTPQSEHSPNGPPGQRSTAANTSRPGSCSAWPYYAATQAGDVDLRAHILSDVATQQLYLGGARDCLEIIRLADGDERVHPAVRFVLHGVRARAFGALGDADGCSRQIGLAEDAYARTKPDEAPEWMNGFLNEAHVDSVTGQAAFSLAEQTGQEEHRAESSTRLARAVRGFDPNTRARAVALCATRLAILDQRRDETAAARTWMGQAVAASQDLRSVRISRDLDSAKTIVRSA